MIFADGASYAEVAFTEVFVMAVVFRTGTVLVFV